MEKILDPGEPLRDWPVEGTVGYEFLNDVAALFVDPAGEAPLTALWEELAGDARPFGAWAAEAKREQARTTFAPDVEWLRRAVAGRRGARGGARGAARLPHLHPRRCRRRRTCTCCARPGSSAGSPARRAAFVTRFQQTTPPIMAKGVEDTAFYRYVRLLALNDVGGDPSRWSIDVDAFHAGNARARRALPAPPARLADARHQALGRRARAARRAGRAGGGVGGRGAAAGASCALRCARTARPDAIEEYTIFQTLVGAWPIEPERLCAYMEKAMREGKRNTTWVGAGRRVGGARARLLPRALRPRAVPRGVRAVRRARRASLGELHALRQTALRLTVPGVPDVYQGDELVALSLVDPDNRRPVDWERRARCCELRDGAAPDSRRRAQAAG